MAQTHDAVVVGAGHNGLVAANLLADAGWDVLVLEAHRARRAAPCAARRDRRARLHHRPVQRVLPAGGRLARCCARSTWSSTGCAGRTRRTCWRTSSTTAAPRCSRRDLDRTAASLDAVRRRRRRRLAARQHDRWAEIADAAARRAVHARSRRCAPALRLAAPARRRRRRCGWPASACCRSAGSARRSSAARAPACCSPATRCTPTWRPDVRGQRRSTAGCSPCSARTVGFPVPAGRRRRHHRRAASRRLGARRRGPLRRPGRPRARSRDGRADRGRLTADGERVPAPRAVLADVPAPTLYRGWSAGRTAARPAARRPGPLPVGRRDRQGRLGPARAGAVDAPGRRGRRHRAPRRRPGRARPATPPTWRPARPGAAVRALRPDDHRRPDPVAGRHRVGVGLHPPAARRLVGRRGWPAAARADRGRGRAARARLPRPGRRPAASQAPATWRPPSRAWSAARSTAAPPRCTSSWSSARRPGSAGPTRRCPALPGRRRRRTRAAACTAPAAPTPPGRRWPGRGSAAVVYDRAMGTLEDLLMR